jgi:hypothetical protein
MLQVRFLGIGVMVLLDMGMRTGLCRIVVGMSNMLGHSLYRDLCPSLCRYQSLFLVQTID